MKRKLNRVGQSTLTISIPKEWADRNNLKKGDEVDVDSTRGDILTISSKNRATKTIAVNVPPDKEIIFRFLKLGFNRGANEIKLMFKDKICADFIEENMPRFIGLELIEKTDSYCIVRRIADIKEGEFDKVLKKLFFLVSSMGSEICQNFENKKTNDISHILEMETTVNKLYIFCQRYIYSTGWKFFKNPILYYNLVARLENMADYFCLIAKYYSKSKSVKISKSSFRFSKDVLDYLDSMQKYYYNFSLDSFKETFYTYYKLLDRGTKLYRSTYREELLLVGRLLEIIALVRDASGSISDIKILEKEEKVFYEKET